jgi:predicted Fe-Mo cluster-binding NifX family protein
MIILISSNDNSLASRVNPRFGRAPWFIRYDTEDDSWHAFENQAVSQRGGAGVAAAQFAVDQSIQAVVSGNFGPNAQQALSAGGIEMYTFDSDQTSVKEVIQAFKAGNLNKVD